jgi:hypothetical protein
VIYSQTETHEIAMTFIDSLSDYLGKNETCLQAAVLASLTGIFIMYAEVDNDMVDSCLQNQGSTELRFLIDYNLSYQKFFKFVLFLNLLAPEFYI